MLFSQFIESQHKKSHRVDEAASIKLSKYNKFSSCTIKDLDANKLINFGTFMKICGSDEAREEFSTDDYKFMKEATKYAHQGKYQFWDFINWFISEDFDFDITKLNNQGAVVNVANGGRCFCLTLATTPDHDLTNGL